MAKLQLRCRIYKNKKGIGIDEALPAVVVIILIVFGIIGFKVYMDIKNNKALSSIQHKTDVLDGDGILAQYLTESDEKGGNKADFISKSYLEKDYEKIKKDMFGYFDKALSFLSAWRIEVSDKTQQHLFSVESKNYYSAYQYEITQVGSMVIPVDGAEYLELKLFFGRAIQ